MKLIRVAYPMRVDALDKPGGDLLQIQKYIATGPATSPAFVGQVIVDLASDLSAFDIIHLTNVDRPVELYHYFRRATKAGKPIVLSPIHHAYSEIERFEREARIGPIGRVSRFLKFSNLELLRSMLRCRTYPRLLWPLLKVLASGTRRAQATVVETVDHVFLLTDKERKDIAKDILPVNPLRSTRLRNGCPDAQLPTVNADTAVRDVDVCIVGRIEARKNQNAILAALNRLGCSGVFIGKENPHHEAYCRDFKRLIVGSKSRYLGALSHAETLAVMRRSKVHVSASWFEVSSLVDIEAYCAGCRVVSSASGGTQELLGSRARYIDPGSPQQLEGAVADALEECAHRNPPFVSESSLDLDTWEAVGERLAATYRTILDNREDISGCVASRTSGSYLQRVS